MRVPCSIISSLSESTIAPATSVRGETGRACCACADATLDTFAMATMKARTTERLGGRRGTMPRIVTASGPPAEFGQNRLEHWQHRAGPLRADDEVPQRLELLPAGGVRRVPQGRRPVVVRHRAAANRPPGVEVAIRAPVTLLELLGRHPRRTEYRVPRVVAV